METNPLNRRINQWTDIYIIGTSIMKVLKALSKIFEDENYVFL